MQKIDSYKQYIELVDSTMHRIPVSNIYMRGELMAGHIKEGVLYYSATSGNASLFFLEQGELYKMYYSIDLAAIKQVTLPQLPKPILVDIVYIEKKGEPGEIDIMRNSGLEKLILRKQYSVNIHTANLPSSDLGGYRICHPVSGQAEALMSMLEGTFSKIANELPNVSELRQRITEKAVVCLYSPEGDICGGCLCEWADGSCQIKNTFILPAQRGRGFGKALYLEVFRLTGALNYKCFVAVNNTAMQKMVAGLGFKYTGKHMLTLSKNYPPSPQAILY